MSNGQRKRSLGQRELEWLATSRGELPRTLLKIKNVKAVAGQDKAHLAMWQLLVGAGFALWRALPLFERPIRDRGPAAEDADQVLYELVAHNRIAYAEEQRTRAWFAGYYLNDARWRIERAKTLAETPPREPSHDREEWNALHDSLKQLIEQLEASLSVVPD